MRPTTSISVEQLKAAWLKPFKDEDEGGCPGQPAHAPWFAGRAPWDAAATLVEAARE